MTNDVIILDFEDNNLNMSLKILLVPKFFIFLFCLKKGEYALSLSSRGMSNGQGDGSLNVVSEGDLPSVIFVSQSVVFVGGRVGH